MRWRPVEQTGSQPHQHNFQRENGSMRQIFPHHDLPEADRRSEEELRAAAIGSKIVVGKIGQQQQ